MSKVPEIVLGRSVLSRLLHWAMMVSMASCFLMVIITVADVLSRHFLKRAIAGVFELNEVLMVMVVFLGLGIAQEEKAHIRAELLISRASIQVRRWFDIFAHSVGFLFWGVIFIQSISKAWDSFLTREYKEGLIKFPVWPVRWALVIGVLLLCLQLLSDIYATFRSKQDPAGGKG